MFSWPRRCCVNKRSETLEITRCSEGLSVLLVSLTACQSALYSLQFRNEELAVCRYF